MTRGLIELLAVLALLGAGNLFGQKTQGQREFETFVEWKKAPEHARFSWEQALDSYRALLRARGATEADAERKIRLIVAYDEAELYNRVYAGKPEFNTQPNAFLVESVEGVRPGDALDAGMGQGRNAIYLARQGWTVTGFDVAEVGLRKARELASALGLRVNTVLAADEEFDFSAARWDLIAIIHALEKRSVHRVARALRPGGIVVLEAAHAEPGGYPFGYASGELTKMFAGFQILRYEEPLAVHDFSDDRTREERLVRLAARKPR